MLTNEQMKLINERQRRYKELMALSESSHFDRSLIDQSNRPQSELPSDYVFKKQSQSNFIKSYYK